MKLRQLIVFILLAMMIAFPLLANAQRIVEVGIYQNRPGVFTSESGEIQGFYIDILEYIAQQEAWQLHYVAGSWTEGLNHLQRGQIDLLLAIAYSKARAKQYEFTKETVFSNWGQVYIRDLEIQSILDLEGKKVAGLKNDIYTIQLGQLLQRLGISHQMVEMSEYHHVLNQIALGKVDAGVISRATGTVIEKEYQVFRSPIVCCPVEVRFAVLKHQNPDLITALNHHLHDLKHNKESIYYQSMQRWFGRGVDPHLPTWVLIVFTIIMVLLTLFAITMLILKHQKEVQLAHAEHISAIKSQELERRLTINKLLETTLSPMSLVEQMEALLDIVFTIPWVALLPQGAIFLVDPETGSISLVAQRGFSQELLKKCQQVRPGECQCGRVAVEGVTRFTDHVDHEHEIQTENMVDHGHYCIPIQSSERTIGVITLYVKAGHERKSEEEEILNSVAITIAGLIERKLLENKLQQQAELDELTSLPNRTLFHDRLTQAITMANRTHTECVLMFLDLDHFKQVNDTMGHKVGDRLLQEAAKRIMACIRDTDTVARLGGDEFTIILPKLTHHFYVEFVARRIIEEISKPFHFAEGEAEISCSVGITIFPNDATDIEHMIKNADTAMYYAKDAGRAAFRFFEEEMTANAMKRMDMEKALKQALEKDEFVIHYQPKVEPGSGKTLGMEALVRWQRPNVGMVSPGEFIPVAEQTGLIVPIGARVLELACHQNQAWIDAGRPAMCVSVNLSTRQFKQPEKLLSTIKATLQQSRLPACYLELEITESMMMEEMEVAITLMEQVKALGVNISVDDFGTGYSSLSTLKNMPIQTLKIDRSFIVGLVDDQDSIVIVSAIIALAKQLNLKVVAEGVEQADQVAFLDKIGCDEIQGFYYSKPLSPQAFELYLDQA